MHSCCSSSSTSGELDRFTDRIENVLHSEKGRKKFRNFMKTSKFNKGCRILNFWELVEKLLESSSDAESDSYQEDIDHVISKAERIDELDEDAISKLSDAMKTKNKQEINDALRTLKTEGAKALRREYKAFQKHELEKLK